MLFQTYLVTGGNGLVTWVKGTAPLQLMSTMYRKDNAFQKKTASLKARVVINKEEKTLGKTEVDLAMYCTPGHEMGTPTDIKLGDFVLKCRVYSRVVPVGVSDDSVSMVCPLNYY